MTLIVLGYPYDVSRYRLYDLKPTPSLGKSANLHSSSLSDLTEDDSASPDVLTSAGRLDNPSRWLPVLSGTATSPDGSYSVAFSSPALKLPQSERSVGT